VDYIDDKIHLFIERQFPERFRLDGPLLVKFIEYYYQWLESEGQPIHNMTRLKQYHDVETSPDYFFQFLRDQFMQSIPNKLVVDERLLIRHIVDFYRAKGSEDAYRLLFRILFNDEIDFYYPGSDILRVSDGRWTIEKSLYITNVLVDPQTNVEQNTYQSIIGVQSGARAEFVSFIEYFDDGKLVQVIYVTNVHGTFIAKESLRSMVTGEILCDITAQALQTSSGRYVGTYGFISWDKYIQDNEFYQEYSYVIRSQESITQYQDAAVALCHPAGTRLFGQILVQPIVDLYVQNAIFIEESQNVTFTFIIELPTYFMTDDQVVWFHEIDIWVSTSEGLVANASIDEATTIAGEGWVSTGNTTIQCYADYPLSELANVPVGMTGSKRLIRGFHTQFLEQVDIMSSLVVSDTINNATVSIPVTTLYSNSFMLTSAEYPQNDILFQKFTATKVDQTPITDEVITGGGLLRITTVPANYTSDTTLVPDYLKGTKHLIEGYSGANFSTEKAFANNVISITHPSTGKITTYPIVARYSNNFIAIESDYYFPVSTTVQGASYQITVYQDTE
jgi:hypothetical protein